MKNINTVVVGRCGTGYAKVLAEGLKLSLFEYQVHHFSSGEIAVELAENLKDQRVVVVAEFTSAGTVAINNEFLELLALLKKIQLSGVKNLTLVAPYLPYTRAVDVLSTPLGLLLELLKTFPKAKLVTVDIHDTAFVSAYKNLVVALDSSLVWAGHLASRIKGLSCCVVSPDQGGNARAQLLGALLNLPVYSLEKTRMPDGSVTFTNKKINVSGLTVLLRDDIVDSGSTALKAAQRLEEMGALQIIGCFTHPVFSSGSLELFQRGVFDEVLVMNTLPSKILPFQHVLLDDYLMTVLQNELELKNDEYPNS